MSEMVEKLTGRKQSAETQEALSSVIFGSGISLGDLLDSSSRDRLRVGLWPFVSTAEPETAMGIASVLGFLLEAWPAIRVYRLFSQLDGDPTDYKENIQKSQFGVDDWELEGLDENVAIWGSLDVTNGQYSLSIEIENDLVEDDVKVLTLNSDTLGGLLSKLISAAQDIADYLDAGEINPVSVAFSTEAITEGGLKKLLKEAFLWELHLFLYVWGKAWSNDEIEADLKRLIAVGTQVKPDLGAWLVAQSVARALSPVFAPINEFLLQELSLVAGAFEDIPVAALILGPAAFVAGDSIQAYDLLETSVEIHPESVVNWLGLAELFGLDNELGSSIDAYQRAIEADVVSVTLYMRYADLMNFLHANNIVLSPGTSRNSGSGLSYEERLVLIEPEEGNNRILLEEASEAYRAVLELDPDNVPALYHLTSYLVEEDDEDALWSQFALLVKNDRDGEYIRNVVDLFYNLEGVSSGIKILRAAADDAPTRPDLRISLAAAYLIDEDGDAARIELEKVRPLVNDDSQTQAEIDRLTLAAEDPNFEAHIGEITDLVNSGSELSAEDVEFLEQVLDDTPTFAEGYVLLASAYLAWEETDDALEVLLDGQKQAPHDPEITMMLARVLWDSEAEDLAFDYLNKGLAQNPGHVGMLALTGQYLFDDGQDLAAKEFLARAQALNPADPALRAARTHIARTLSDIDTE
jgi:tetratricopeptide (TPR) repeat protein